MRKFLLNTNFAPTDQIISESFLSKGNLTPEMLTEVPDPAIECPSEDHILIADRDNAGIWTTSWMLKSDYDAIQQTRHLAYQLKRKRNIMLASTDWTQGKDVPAEISNKWTAYRQALRDITSQPGFPTNVVWPSQP